MIDKVVKLVLKLLVKQFKLEKLEKVYEYVFNDNPTDLQVRQNTKDIKYIKKSLIGDFTPKMPTKKWYDK